MFIYVYSDCLNGVFSVWWSLEEDVVVVLVLVRVQIQVLELDSWIIKCGNSFCQRLPVVFLSRTL